MKWSILVCLLATATAYSQAGAAQPEPDKYYYIEHKPSGLFIFTAATENDKPVEMGGPILKGHEDQYAFQMTASRDKDYVYLIHKASGKYLCADANAEAPLHLGGPLPKNDQDAFLFKLFDAGEGYYYLLYKSSGRYAYSQSKQGSELTLKTPVPDIGQVAYKFRFLPSAPASGGGGTSK